MVQIDNQGVRLEYSAVGSGPVLLFLNGAGDARETWDEVIAGLLPGYRCVTMDMRGQGDAGRPSDPYSIKDFASDALTVLNAVGEPAVLVGHSLGGVTAFEVARSGHPLVRGIFLEDPPLYLGDQHAFESTRFPDLFRWVRREIGAMQVGGASPAAFAELIAGLPTPDGRMTREVWTTGAIESAGRSWARWDMTMVDALLDGTALGDVHPDVTLPCPAVVLQSDPALGAAFRPEDRERFLTSNPTARVIPFDGANHMIHGAREFQDRLVTELRDFVASLP
ncbi:MAG: alpha/beta fold hydrolase [Acidimicrobiales bacterium]